MMSGTKGHSGRPKQDPVERLRLNVEKARAGRTADECWPWPKSLDQDGYGKCYMAELGGVMPAHRAVYEQFVGSIPKEKPSVLHSCHNRDCVNYEKHLRAGTALDNSNDMISAGRQASHLGERNGYAKLARVQVKTARIAYLKYGIPYKMIAEKYGVHQATIGAAVRGNNWSHV